MTQVDFYTIQEVADSARFHFACRLTEKACANGLKVYIHLEDKQSAEELDTLLWSFKPESFIPHAVMGTLEHEEEAELPVLIGCQNEYTGSAELIINLHSAVPDFASKFKRLAEIVVNNEQAKQQSRQHWSAYKQAGFDLHHHQL